MAKVALSSNKIAEAEDYLFQCLRITSEIGLVRDRLNLLYDYACLLVAQGNPEKAIELLTLVLQHPASYQIRLGEGRIRDSAKSLLLKIKDKIAPLVYAAALERGQELSLDEVIAELVSPDS